MASELQEHLPALITAAWQARAAFHANTATDCYRVFHGYTEGLSGFSIDRYGAAAVINKKVACSIADDELVATLRGLFPFEQIVQKAHQRVSAGWGSRVQYLYGEKAAAPHKVKEGGDWYFADLDHLHSNGLYMDTRPARRWLKQNSQGRRIYNLFSHTGSLGVAARLGGAKDVVHIDKSADALAKIRLSHDFNGLRHDDRGMLKGDIYHHLPRAIKWGQKFEGIILDPPPFIAPPLRPLAHTPVGQDFKTLIDLSCKILAPGGWLLCIYHDFRKDHDACDQEIIVASGGVLKPIWRDQADPDFVEHDPNRWTRMSTFVRT